MDNFEIIDILGEGSFSIVYKVKRKLDNQIYALKKVSLQNLIEKKILNSLNEIRILASIKSNNVISYKEAFYEEKENSLIIVMEYADNGDLLKKIKKLKKTKIFFEEKEIWKIFIQLIIGLKSLHDLNILHRDIKSANVFLFNNGMAKLGDLNVSKVAKKGLSYTQTGTPNYAAPEIWKNLPYNYKSDIWSLGCVLYEMITLNLPFINNSGKLYSNIIKGEIKKIPEKYSEDLDNIVHLLIQINQDKRPSCKELLNNPVIKNKIELLKNENMDFNFDENNIENSILLKTIGMPKNLAKTSFRFPKANYTKTEIEKSFDNLKSNINNKSNLYKDNFSYNMNNANLNLPIIRLSKKKLYEKEINNYGRNRRFDIHRIINKIKNDNNIFEYNEINKNYNNKNNIKIKNFNMQWIKLRNFGKNNFINNGNILNKSNDSIMKIMKLYKPMNFSNDNSLNKTKKKDKSYESKNKNEYQIMPLIKRNYNNQKYSLIKFTTNQNLNIK